MAKNTKPDKTTDVTKQPGEVDVTPTTTIEVAPVTGTEVEKTASETKPTEKEVQKATREQVSKATKVQDAFIVPYAKAYPGERAFHVTSDNQVFLERDRGLAVLHQNSLGNDEKVQTVKIK